MERRTWILNKSNYANIIDARLLYIVRVGMFMNACNMYKYFCTYFWHHKHKSRMGV